MKTDILFKLSHTIRTSINKSLNGKFIKSKRTFEILGCSLIEFKVYLEFKFDEKMTWENHGEYWHIDHIIPISWAKSEEDVYKLNHYSNLQPLNAIDNLSKNNRYAG